MVLALCDSNQGEEDEDHQWVTIPWFANKGD